jgi:hypothetical protein
MGFSVDKEGHDHCEFSCRILLFYDWHLFGVRSCVIACAPIWVFDIYKTLLIKNIYIDIYVQ